jgi:hypothetical protein
MIVPIVAVAGVLDVEWGSPTGAATTLERGTVNLHYERGTQNC